MYSLTSSTVLFAEINSDEFDASIP